MISSKDNSIIKHFKSLSQKKARDEYGEYIVEGIKLVKEAFTYTDISTCLVCEELLDKVSLDDIKKLAIESNTKLEAVSTNVFKSITDTQTPQGVIAIAKQKYNYDLLTNIKALKKDNTVFVLDNVQDPGNVGTIIRTLDSAGIKHLILSQDSADIYNPKVVRSTMGAIFRLNFYKPKSELFETLESLKQEGFKVVTTDLKAKDYFYALDFNQNLAIVVGNESQGVSEKVRSISDIKVKIPMIGKTESLNVAVATSIIAYEKVRKNITKD
jgi:TrmH family RNA methyltransferase